MKTRNFSSSLIGQRLVEAGHLTEAQLREALEAQKKTGLLLGEICLLKGFVSYRDLKDCLPPLRTRLGERLLACGYINMDQLWQALLEQRVSGARLGEILTRRGWVDRGVIEAVMAPPAKRGDGDPV